MSVHLDLQPRCRSRCRDAAMLPFKRGSWRRALRRAGIPRRHASSNRWGPAQTCTGASAGRTLGASAEAAGSMLQQLQHPEEAHRGRSTRESPQARTLGCRAHSPTSVHIPPWGAEPVPRSGWRRSCAARQPACAPPPGSRRTRAASSPRSAGRRTAARRAPSTAASGCARRWTLATSASASR